MDSPGLISTSVKKTQPPFQESENKVTNMEKYKFLRINTLACHDENNNFRTILYTNHISLKTILLGGYLCPNATCGILNGIVTLLYFRVKPIL